ncbi:dihydroxyacetone kinase phosphoryl donor subunit DhaM [Xylanimonas allomyrinae]|uniref:dihydroxyacetone kinase phosphoryl donor subunit DhaM n=1 Tax=Xylanimonas allomyrinae TaxID=2509459 RepID=UPI001FE5F267|nr:dihydroxyacetone kinase phosphoryl donor subunit DhaM [Xylanimonas allomyrinae]
MTVALVLVSHSARLARGVVELAAQMAPDVEIVPGAGTIDGGLGTSLDVVQGAVERALAGADAVVVLADLGSAVLTVETALEIDEDEWSGRVHLVDAPFVEGAVAAAVAAQQGAGPDAVMAAAREAGESFAPAAGAPGAPADAAGPVAHDDEDGVVRASVTVRNPLGLHARPAAQLARAIADLGVPVSVGERTGRASWR